MRIIVIGGGWSGCAAAVAAARQGAEVTLLERTDMLLGTGLVGGIFRNNGRFTAAEEMIAMGGGEMFHAMEACKTHTNIEFPGHHHASLYNIATIEPEVQRVLARAGVKVEYMKRITDVEMDGRRIVAVRTKKNEGNERFEADAFVETTGTAAVVNVCAQHGNGCSMCILRCHTFGIRVGIASRCGVKEIDGHKRDQIGAMSGSCKLLKESLSPEIVEELNRTGVVVVPIPKTGNGSGEKLEIKACQQYALPEYQDNIVLLNTGHAKLMTPYFPQADLRKVPGFENARFEDPYSGGVGNSIRFVGMAPRDDALKVDNVDNLFCAGEKAGLLVGHTEAVVTGVAGRPQRRALAARRSAIGAARCAVHRRRDPPCARGNADRKRAGPEVHLLGLGLFRAHEGARLVHRRRRRDPAARRAGWSDRCLRRAGGDTGRDRAPQLRAGRPGRHAGRKLITGSGAGSSRPHWRECGAGRGGGRSGWFSKSRHKNRRAAGRDSSSRTADTAAPLRRRDAVPEAAERLRRHEKWKQPRA